jgi:NADPH:quinone reductase
MKTIVSQAHQAKLEIVDATPPIAGSGQVIVDVRAIGVGRVDLIMRQLIPTDFVPGIEVSGIVSALGPDTDPDWLGKRVFARMQAGAYAEQVAVEASMLVPLPAAVGFEAAVASGVNALVAHFCLAKGGATENETVLVRGANGGIGHLVVQMAKAGGVHVIESSRNGSPQPADVVIDLVGGPDAGAYLEQVRANGRYVIAGISAGMPRDDFTVSLLHDFRRSRSVATLSLDSISDSDIKDAATSIFEDVATGRLRPAIATTLKLHQADDALHLLDAGGIEGKIVLVP